MESGEEEIYLPKSVTAEGFEPILEYLYTGNLRIHDDTYTQIKTAAQVLEIRSVCVLCDAFGKITGQGKASVTVKNVGKNDSEKSESADDSAEKKVNAEQKAPIPATSASGICTNSIIPESLRSSLSVSVASSETYSSKTAPSIKRLNSGLEIIPISAPSDPKQARRRENESQSSNHKAEAFDYEELDDLSDSEEYYSDEEGLSDFAEEEALIRELEKKGALKKAKQAEQTEKTAKCPPQEKIEEESSTVAKPS